METKGYSYLENISSSDITSTTVGVELNQAYTPEYMKNISDTIIIANITSIDDADMKYNDIVGYTYGKLEVLQTLYGDVKQGDILEFAKPGAILSYDEWNQAQPSEDQEKEMI